MESTFSWLPAAVAVHFVVLGIIVFLLAAILFFRVR